MSQLILPRHVGERRYGPQRPQAPAEAEDPQNERRPLTYQTQVEGRTVLIPNAVAMSWRIPVDELRAMALAQTARRRRKGEAQEREDWARVLRQYWADRRNAAWDRRNGRVSFSAATFAGSRKR